ncbi:MAG: hypothetical protein J7L38_06030 [Thermoproteales archaeon]|nr:hypothetical protein [Thermoproteales archaeon]
METRCPVCGAEIEVPKTISTTECPYCGTVFDVKTGEKSRLEHFYFPVYVKDPYDKLMRFLGRQYGVPTDLKLSSTYTKRLLHIVPIFFYHLHGRALVEAKSRKLGSFTAVVEEVDDIGIPAFSGKIAELLKEYPFPLRGKKFFEEKLKTMGIYYEPEIERVEADRTAETILTEKLSKEASEVAENFRLTKFLEFKVEHKGLVYYPIWELEYQYKGNVFKGFIDGVTGTVIQGEHPLALRSRVIQFTWSLVFIATGILFGFLVLQQSGAGLPGIAAALFSFIAGVAAALPQLIRTGARKVSASEILHPTPDKPKEILKKISKPLLSGEITLKYGEI